MTEKLKARVNVLEQGKQPKGRFEVDGEWLTLAEALRVFRLRTIAQNDQRRRERLAAGEAQ